MTIKWMKIYGHTHTRTQNVRLEEFAFFLMNYFDKCVSVRFVFFVASFLLCGGLMCLMFSEIDTLILGLSQAKRCKNEPNSKFLLYIYIIWMGVLVVVYCITCAQTMIHKCLWTFKMWSFVKMYFVIWKLWHMMKPNGGFLRQGFCSNF